MDDDSLPTVFIILGRAWPNAAADPETVHILVAAPDEDSAVRAALNALADESYEEADLDQIGLLEDAPDEEPHLSAYDGALNGEVAIIRFTE